MSKLKLTIYTFFVSEKFEYYNSVGQLKKKIGNISFSCGTIEGIQCMFCEKPNALNVTIITFKPTPTWRETSINLKFFLACLPIPSYPPKLGNHMPSIVCFILLC
jgi:hypothetical protein